MAARVEPLVVWINGAFGFGKTSVTEELVPLMPGSLLFDPEMVGVMLRDVIPADEQTDDFQDIPAWRELTRDAVVSLARTRPPGVIVARGVRVVHITLEAPAEVMAERFRARSGGEEWGLDRVAGCVGALRDERFATHLDASSAGPQELARQIAALVGESAVPVRA